MKSNPEQSIPAFFLLFFIVVPATSIADGAVLAQFWTWFVVDTFHAPTLNLVTAIGLSTLAQFLCARRAKDDSDDEPYVAVLTLLAGSLWRTLMFYAVGAVVHAFM